MEVKIIRSQRGNEQLIYNNCIFYKKELSGVTGIQRWRCSENSKQGCTVTMYTSEGIVVKEPGDHNHSAYTDAQLEVKLHHRAMIEDSVNIGAGKMNKHYEDSTAKMVKTGISYAKIAEHFKPYRKVRIKV